MVVILIECEYCHKNVRDVVNEFICIPCSKKTYSSNKSNINGHGFEYFLCVEINSEYNVQCLSKSFSRYKDNVDVLTLSEKEYLKCSSTYAMQFVRNILKNKQMVSTTLNSDSKGTKCLVGDIVVHHKDGTETNFSLKNNKLSCKHPRPTSIIGRCNFPDKEYRERIKGINDSFFSKFSDKKLFRCVCKSDIKELYKNINNEVVRHINMLRKEHVKSLFKFLNGIDSSLYIIYNTKKSVQCYDSSDIFIPTRVVTSIDGRGYIILEFNNKCYFSMRLHTAASKITKILSIKYDVTLENADIVYNKAEIKK